MKRTIIGFLLASLATFALLVIVQAFNYNIVSSNIWTVTDANGTTLGPAQHVCLSSTSPNCPPGATSYGYTPADAWTATIPGASWIWAPNITGTTTGAANAVFTFESFFYLCDVPTGGTIAVAADDSADVFLNYATTPIVTSTGFTSLSTVTVPASSLTRGLNNIQVKVKNASGCASDEYQCNPAGFIFGGSFTDPLQALPTCTGNNNMTFNVGQFEPLSCRAGQTGSASRPCICPPIGPVQGVWGPPDYSRCVTPPVTCTGNNGAIFNVGQTEPQACPSGLSGSASRACQPNGTWGPTDTSKCVPPPTTCTGSTGTLFGVGMSETLACPAGLVGSPPLSHTCQADGTWGPTSGTCVLPPVIAGAICGSTATGPTASCPAGTTCKSRFSKPPRPDWCWSIILCKIFTIGLCPTPSECDPVGVQTTDWYCDP